MPNEYNKGGWIPELSPKQEEALKDLTSVRIQAGRRQSMVNDYDYKKDLKSQNLDDRKAMTEYFVFLHDLFGASLYTARSLGRKAFGYYEVQHTPEFKAYQRNPRKMRSLYGNSSELERALNLSIALYTTLGAELQRLDVVYNSHYNEKKVDFFEGSDYEGLVVYLDSVVLDLNFMLSLTQKTVSRIERYNSLIER